MISGRAAIGHAVVLALALVIALVCHSPRVADGASGLELARARRDLDEIARVPHSIVDVAAKGRVRDHLLARMKELAAAFPAVDGRRASVAVQTGAWPAPYWLRDRWEREEPIAEAYALENLALHIPGTSNAGALVLCAHYDSRFDAAGASDDGAACASWLEVLRVLSQDGAPSHDLLLLFTDGEELGLEGAWFFKQRREEATAGDESIWNLPLLGVLNFEAIGNNGPSILFQTGLESGAFLRAYERAAPHPVGSSIAPWIYAQLRNDTDLSVFREMGLPGLNFAIVGGGSAYHKPFDTSENLSDATLSYQGETMLAVTREVLRIEATELRAPTTGFQDVAGVAFVTFPPKLGRWLAIIAVIASASTLLAGRKGSKLAALALGLMQGVFVIAASALLAWVIVWVGSQLGHLVAPALSVESVPRGNRTSMALVFTASLVAATAVRGIFGLQESFALRTTGALVIVAALAQALSSVAPEGAHALAIPVFFGLAATLCLTRETPTKAMHIAAACAGVCAILAFVPLLHLLIQVLGRQPGLAHILAAVSAALVTACVGPILDRLPAGGLAAIASSVAFLTALAAGLIAASGA